MENKNILNEEELGQVAGGSGYSPSYIYEMACSQIGMPASSFQDTSSFVSYCVTGGASLRIGTTATFLTWMQPSDPQPGDICTNSGYCGIYAGNGQMIYPSSARGQVILGNMAAGMIIVRYN